MQYPIGNFELPEYDIAKANRLQYIRQIGDLPAQVREVALQLKAKDQLEGTYRDGSWTARQVIHHLCDSHVNAYVRHRRVLAEDHPTIYGYNEKIWANLPDVTAVPIEASLEALKGLHLRWAMLLATCTDEQWLRTAYHAGSGWTYRLDTLAAHYAWHGQHHLSHLKIVAGS